MDFSSPGNVGFNAMYSIPGSGENAPCGQGCFPAGEGSYGNGGGWDPLRHGGGLSKRNSKIYRLGI